MKALGQEKGIFNLNPAESKEKTRGRPERTSISRVGGREAKTQQKKKSYI